MDFVQLTEDQLRQAIDAESTFVALEHARWAAADVRGSMFWRVDKAKEYLVRATTNARQTRLGVRNDDTEAMYQRFTERKAAVDARVQSLEQGVDRHRRMNLALRVGRCPNILVKILDRFERQGLSEHFLTVGTHAMYAFEAAAGVRVIPDALATRDVDVLFDTRKQLTFFTRLETDDLSFIAILRKVDRTFEIIPDQLQTAVNADGFEVDVIRRVAQDGDLHPMRMSHKEDDLWAVQVSSGGRTPSAARFSQMVVSTDGSMARLTTIEPHDFVDVKHKLSQSTDREPVKRTKDALQAGIVRQLIDQFSIDRLGRLPQYRQRVDANPRASAAKRRPPATRRT